MTKSLIMQNFQKIILDLVHCKPLGFIKTSYFNKFKKKKKKLYNWTLSRIPSKKMGSSKDISEF